MRRTKTQKKNDSIARLYYHHWDDNHPEFGIWVCMPCHSIVEAIEKNLIEEIITDYENMKGIINAQQKII
jgi:mannosyltransferase OCH1-like enzyme